MKTIRTKMFLLFALLMVSLIFCGILFNVLFLERYYIYKNKDAFIETSKAISDQYQTNRGDITDYITQIEHIEAISSTITDNNFNIKYASSTQKSSANDQPKLSKEIQQFIVNNQTKLKSTYVYSVIDKRSSQVPKLVFVSRIGSGGFLILTKPLKGISESAYIANQFYIFAGLIILLIGGIMMYLFSKRITKPIVEMSNVAQEISNLNFSKRLSINSEDEIGSLSKSINNISDKLSISMNTLKQDIERRKELVRNMSHDLKTPIGVIKGYAEGLRYGVADDKEKMDRYCLVIAQECDRMDNMVQELLDLSLLESASIKLNITDIDACGLIQNVINQFAIALNEKGLSYDIQCDSSLHISGDYDLLFRAISNFLSNALKFTGGRKHIKVEAKKLGNRTRISVFNTGSHIPTSDINNIWDVFYKADKVRSREHAGHGIGLSIVKLIVQLHGGSCGAENVDDGVVFYLELP